jgi:hemoglobin/transferrin/lactoferrin receptor protein
LNINALASGSIAYENLAPSEREKPHLYAVDKDGNPFSPDWITYNFNISWFASKQLRLTGGIENILDARYRTYSSGIAAPGRNYIASLTFHF